jgi:sec-independent protein translocase protein TatA
MPNLGAPELLIVLVIVLLIFGVGRITGVFGEVGRGIREFRRGLKGDEEEKPEAKANEGQGGTPPK